MRGDETTSSTRMFCGGSSIARGDDDITFSSNMDSPPPDAIWTIDKVLQKPPMAPIRQRPSRGGSSISTRESQNEYLQTYFDVRNQEDPFDNQNEHSETFGEYLNNESSYHQMLHNFDDDDDDDEEMVHLHRMILPSRKLFVEDELDEESMIVEVTEHNDTFNAVFMNTTTYGYEARFQETSRASHMPVSQLPIRLLLPTLHNTESVSECDKEDGIDLNGTTSTNNNHSSLFEYNHKSLLQGFDPALVEDDFISCAVSSSTADDDVSIGYNSVERLDSESNFNINLSPGRVGGNQIFRRLEDGEETNSIDQRHSLQFFRPLPSSLFENYASDAVATEQDTKHYND
jgi:hypothetical protein